MKTRLSLLVALAALAGILCGCSGISEEQAKKVDLNATPKNPPKQGGGGAGGESKPGPGSQAKPV